MSKYEGIWILGELDEQGFVSRTTLELLGLGRRLADDMSEHLCAIFIGEDTASVAEESISRGSDRVYTIEDPSLCAYNFDLYLSVLEELWRDCRPHVLLAGHTALGQDLLPRLAARLKTRVLTDCIQLTMDKEAGALLMTKPIYGGNALAVFSCESLPKMATVRMRTNRPLDIDTSREGEIFRCDFPLDPNTAGKKTISRIKVENGAMKLEDAAIVVSGGRGIGGPDGFNTLRKSAELLGGAVGASRPPCDLGWISPSSQVGFTGRVVAPRLYVAVGISGAMQHISGISESKCIVAINNDAGANIFNFADYGIVGNYREVLPSFIENLGELLSG